MPLSPIIPVGILQVLSALAVLKPVQLSELTVPFYDFQTARSCFSLE